MPGVSKGDGIAKPVASENPARIGPCRSSNPWMEVGNPVERQLLEVRIDRGKDAVATIALSPGFSLGVRVIAREKTPVALRVLEDAASDLILRCLRQTDRSWRYHVKAHDVRIRICQQNGRVGCDDELCSPGLDKLCHPSQERELPLR